MIYDLRVYDAHEGKAEQMRVRFVEEVATRFPNHGIELVGAFVNPQEDGRLTYITRFPSEEAREQAWKSFGADPEWLAVKNASEIDGPLLKSQTVSLLRPHLANLPLA